MHKKTQTGEYGPECASNSILITLVFFAILHFLMVFTVYVVTLTSFRLVKESHSHKPLLSYLVPQEHKKKIQTHTMSTLIQKLPTSLTQTLTCRLADIALYPTKQVSIYNVFKDKKVSFKKFKCVKRRWPFCFHLWNPNTKPPKYIGKWIQQWCGA